MDIEKAKELRDAATVQINILLEGLKRNLGCGLRADIQHIQNFGEHGALPMINIEIVV